MAVGDILAAGETVLLTSTHLVGDVAVPGVDSACLEVHAPAALFYPESHVCDVHLSPALTSTSSTRFALCTCSSAYSAEAMQDGGLTSRGHARQLGPQSLVCAVPHARAAAHEAARAAAADAAACNKENDPSPEAVANSAGPPDAEMLACAADACQAAGSEVGSVSGVTLRPPSGSRKRPCRTSPQPGAPAAKAMACTGAGAAARRCSASAAAGSVSAQQGSARGSACVKADAHAAQCCSMAAAPAGCRGALQVAASATAGGPAATGSAAGAAHDPAGPESGLVSGLGWIDRGALVARVTGLELRRARHAPALLLRMQVQANNGLCSGEGWYIKCSGSSPNLFPRSPFR